MIDYKFYIELKELAEKLGLPADKETMRLYVKLCEKFNESQIVEVNRLKMKNLEGRLQNGQVAVNNKEMKEHLRICKRVIHGIDEAMRMPVNYLRGSRIAKLMNELNSSLFVFNYSVKSTSTIEGQSEYEESLLKHFNEKQDELLLKAACDITKRRNLRFVLSFEGNSGGTVNYNKKENRFDFIEYCVNGYGRQIPI